MVAFFSRFLGHLANRTKFTNACFSGLVDRLYRARAVELVVAFFGRFLGYLANRTNRASRFNVNRCWAGTVILMVAIFRITLLYVAV